MEKVAALFVATGGIYFGREDVDPWGIERDARKYAGPWPVVAHPPCTTWGAMARQGWTLRPLGDDDGCFASALASLRTFGGVLEHPAESSAWRHFGLVRPRAGGWCRAIDGMWCCRVEQGHYGYPSRKPTWLLTNRCDFLPTLEWAPAQGKVSFHRVGCGTTEKGRAARSATPPAFAELLINIAKSARARTEAA